MQECYSFTVLCVCVLVTQSCPAVCDPMDCSPPGSSVHGDSPGKNTEVGCHFLLQGDLPDPGIEPGSLARQADALPSELLGKPQRRGEGSNPPNMYVESKPPEPQNMALF